MSYGIKPQGFVRKTYRQLLGERQDRARQLFGEDADLSDESPLGIFVKLIAWDADKLWQLAEDVYYSQQLSDAEGVSLDKLAAIGLMSRRSEQKALCELTFSGEAGCEIPAGTLAESKQGRIFATIASGVIGTDGRAKIWARDTSAGAGGNVNAGLINSIKTPVSGVNAVTNESGASGGADAETDAEFRARYANQRYATGSSCEAILSAVLALDAVEDATLRENETNATVQDLLPHSISVTVSGGLDTDIADVILKKKPAGIATVGNHTVLVTSDDGAEKSVRFSRPEQVKIYIEYRIVRGSLWNSSCLKEIKQRCVEYVGGYDDAGVKHKGLGLGGRLFQWKLLSAAGDIQGIESAEVLFGRSRNALSSETISFNEGELPETGFDMIEVKLHERL